MKISWLASVGIGVATGITALLVGGWLASRAVTWYHVPTREGGAGYFVVFQALLAGVVGLVLGMVVSRLAGNFMEVTMLRAFASAQAVVLLLLAVIGGVARLRADVPPEIAGEKLLLAVELSWPEASVPVLEAGESRAYLKLRSTAGQGASMPKDGALWTDRTRHDAGRVIVPGAVEIYTSRGKRILQLMNGDSAAAAFQVSLDGYPKQRALQWSEWIPVPAGSSNGDALALSYRYRVVQRNEPVRVDTVGPFRIEMMVKAFQFLQYENELPRLDAEASYRVTYNGQPIPREARRVGRAAIGANSPAVGFNEINAVAVVGGATPALIVELDGQYGTGGVGLIREQNGAAVVEYVSTGVFLRVLAHRFDVAAGIAQPATTLKSIDGGFDTASLARPALYVFPEAVLDSRSLTVHPITREQYDSDLRYVAPVSLSPDGTKLARLGGDPSSAVLREISFITGESREVPVANTPVPDGAWTSADRAWFDYYFEWTGQSPNQLVTAKANTIPMPRRGFLKQETGYREYHVTPVDSGMREVVEQFLVDEFHATRKPPAPNDYAHTFLVEGAPVHVILSDNRVGLFMDRNTDTGLVATIAKRFDAALATRKYDSHFVVSRPE